MFPLSSPKVVQACSLRRRALPVLEIYVVQFFVAEALTPQELLVTRFDSVGILQVAACQPLRLDHILKPASNQFIYSDSRINVTGPSLISETCIEA